jgi:hypothetical protein
MNVARETTVSITLHIHDLLAALKSHFKHDLSVLSLNAANTTVKVVGKSGLMVSCTTNTSPPSGATALVVRDAGGV